MKRSGFVATAAAWATHRRTGRARNAQSKLDGAGHARDIIDILDNRRLDRCGEADLAYVTSPLVMKPLRPIQAMTNSAA